jgi:hypothetical protein
VQSQQFGGLVVEGHVSTVPRCAQSSGVAGRTSAARWAREHLTEAEDDKR